MANCSGSYEDLDLGNFIFLVRYPVNRRCDFMWGMKESKVTLMPPYIAGGNVT